MIARIAMISEHASPLASLGGVDSGGQNVYVSQLAHHLAARGLKVDVFTRRDDPSLPDVVDFITRVRVVHVDAGPPRVLPKEDLLPYMAEFARNMAAFSGRQRAPYDIVHANFWTSGVVAMALERDLGIPFVTTFHALGRVRKQHQGDADRFPRARERIEEEIICASSRVIAECAQDRNDLIQLYGAEPAKVCVVPCGFDPAELRPIDKRVARRELGFGVDERLILQLGRIVPRKGIDVPIRALARLRASYGIEARLIVVGGESDEPSPAATPEIGRLQEIAHEAGVADRVHFTGRRARPVLRYYYSAADVFITTPWYEPFGITPLEAMACATPVIGARVGGIKTTVRDGRTGFLVPPRDPDAVAERLAHLYRHPELFAELGQAGRDRALRSFTWEQVAERVTVLYAHAARTGAVPATRRSELTNTADAREGINYFSSVWQRVT